MKTHKSFRGAKKAAGSNPIVKVGDVYITGATIAGLGLDEIQLIDGGSNRIVAERRAMELLRLHSLKMIELMKQGWTREAASIEAMKGLKQSKKSR